MKISNNMRNITINLAMLIGGISYLNNIEAQTISTQAFEPYAGNGVTILRPKGCNQTYQDDKNSILRDLGQSVTLWVAPSQTGRNIISINYIFIHNGGNDSKFRLTEDEFRLRTIPNDILIKPKTIKMKTVGPNEYGRHQKEVVIEFEGVSTESNSISVEFPDGSIVSNPSDYLHVKPFKFKLLATKDTQQKTEGACFYINDKPIDWEPAIFKNSRPQ